MEEDAPAAAVDDSPDDELRAKVLPPRAWNVGYPAGKFVVKPGKLAIADSGYCRNGGKKGVNHLSVAWLVGRSTDRGESRMLVERTQLRLTKLTAVDVEFFRARRKAIGFVLAMGRTEKRMGPEGEAGSQGPRLGVGERM